MSAAGDEDYEHWPSTDQHSLQTAAPSAGYDTHNGLHFHSYMPAKAKSPSPSEAPPADSKAPSPQPQVINYPQPVYYAHPPNMMAHPQAQYYSHPIYMVPQGYYQPYPAAPPAPVAAPEPAPPAPPAPPSPPSPEPKMHFQSGANSHIYIPAFGAEKPGGDVAAPGANAWLGRTTAQVEEDNMKIAKAEGAYDKRKMAPVDMKDDQMCWVVEVDGSHSLRMFRDIKDMTGTWKEDPRYKGAFYFVREDEKKDKKKK